MLKYFLVIAAFVLIAGVVYVRLAPLDITRYHQLPEPKPAGDYATADGFVAVRGITASQIDIMAAINRVILQTPRTRRVAGDLGTAMITYETRSAVFGFPDYTTVSFLQAGQVENAGPLLVVHGRLRFGLEDLNTNKKRILGWLERLGPLTVSP